MNCSLPKITYPTLRTLLRFKLCGAISPQIDSRVKKVFKVTYQSDFNSSKIELLLEPILLKQRKNDPFAIVYQSAIALKLSSVLRRNALELSYQILDEFQQKDVNFCQESFTIAHYLLSDLTIRVVPPGLLQFELGDRGLSAWLQRLVDFPYPSESIPLKEPLTQPEDSNPLLICQHSHARCCSLLWLAHPSVITLSGSKDNALDDRWMISAPAPLPWLTAQAQLCLTHPAERALICQLVAIVDDLSTLVTIPRSSLGAALALSHSFQAFYRACQIFELASPSSLQRSQTRLGLVLVTQRLLKHLLEVGLGAKAPFEL